MEMKICVTASELVEAGSWERYCSDRKIDSVSIKKDAINKDEEISLTEDEARKYGVLGDNTWK